MKKLGDKRKLKRVENKVYHAFVATPAYDGKVDTYYAQSLANAAFTAPLFHCQASLSVMGNGAFIDLARNIFVKDFLENHKDCTHLFFIDGDLEFPANAFIGLLRAGLPICCGVYPRRQDETDYPVKLATDENNHLIMQDDWLMAERVPTGFLCISREVLEEMAKDARQLKIHGQDGPVPELFYTRIDDDGNFVGEDFCFCDDYIKKYNQYIPVWGNIDFRHGNYKGNLQEHLEKNLKEHGVVSPCTIHTNKESVA